MVMGMPHWATTGGAARGLGGPCPAPGASGHGDGRMGTPLTPGPWPTPDPAAAHRTPGAGLVTD